MAFSVGQKLRASQLNLIGGGGALIVGSRYYSGTLTSSGSEAYVVAWTAGNSSTTFLDGHLYELQLTAGQWNSGTGTVNPFFDNDVKIRKTVNSSSSQVLFDQRIACGGNSSPIVWHTNSAYVKNISGANIAASLGTSVNRSTGAANAVMTGPIVLVVFDLGAIASMDSNTVAGLNPVAIT